MENLTSEAKALLLEMAATQYGGLEASDLQGWVIASGRMMAGRRTRMVEFKRSTIDLLCNTGFIEAVGTESSAVLKEPVEFQLTEKGREATAQLIARLPKAPPFARVPTPQE